MEGERKDAWEWEERKEKGKDEKRKGKSWRQNISPV